MILKNCRLILITCLFALVNASCTENICIDCSNAEVEDQAQEELELFDKDYVSYLKKENLKLEKDGVPFRYVIYKVGDNKFTTEPFNLTNETRFQKKNKNYDAKFDQRFQGMVKAFDNTIDLADKKFYGEGTQSKGLYIQDILSKKYYVFYEICFDPKCSIGRAFFIFDPTNYDIAGISFDGCFFDKRYSTVKGSRINQLIEEYIVTQDPADYSYVPNACKGRSR